MYVSKENSVVAASRSCPGHQRIEGEWDVWCVCVWEKKDMMEKLLAPEASIGLLHMDEVRKPIQSAD